MLRLQQPQLLLMQPILDQKDLWHRDLTSGAMHYVVTLHYHYIEVVSEPLSCSAVQSRSRARHNNLQETRLGRSKARQYDLAHNNVILESTWRTDLATTASERSRRTLSNPPVAVSTAVIHHYLSLLRVSRQHAIIREEQRGDQCGNDSELDSGRRDFSHKKFQQWIRRFAGTPKKQGPVDLVPGHAIGVSLATNTGSSSTGTRVLRR